MRLVNLDENTFMIVDEQENFNIYSVFKHNVLIASEAIKRTNVCSMCGWHGQISNRPIWTHMHHTKLDPLHPSKNLIEVCDYGEGSCHERLHKMSACANSHTAKAVGFLREQIMNLSRA